MVDSKQSVCIVGKACIPQRPRRHRHPRELGSSRECRRVVQLATGITSGNRACRT